MVDKKEQKGILIFTTLFAAVMIPLATIYLFRLNYTNLRTHETNQVQSIPCFMSIM